MMLLAVETAYDVCGAALLDGTDVAHIREQHAPRRHNEMLAPQVAELLAEAQVASTELEAIAVSVGPGSFTGLRVGMSYVKGLAFGAELPVIPVPTLPSLVEGEKIQPRWIATLSHGDIVFAIASDGNDTWTEVQALSWEQLLQLAAGELVAGYSLERFQPWEGLNIVTTCPSAAKVGKFARRKQLAAADLASLVPDYHHEFQPATSTPLPGHSD